MTHRSAPAAFRVLALVDPGRGGRRVAFLAALGGRDSAPLTLPPGAGSVDFVCTGFARRRVRSRAERGGRLPAEIVPEVLAPGDLVVVRPHGGNAEDAPSGARVEALRLLPVAKGREKAMG